MIFNLIKGGLGKLDVDINDAGIIIQTRFASLPFEWSEITGCYLLKALQPNTAVAHPDLKKILPPGMSDYSTVLANSQQLVFIRQKFGQKKAKEFIIMIPQHGPIRDTFLANLKKKCAVNDSGLTYWQAMQQAGIKHNPVMTVLGVIFVFMLAAFILFGWWMILYAALEPFTFWQAIWGH